MPRDPYEVLGLPKSSTLEQIQKAYRKLSKKLHPDRNPGDKAAETQYKEVQEAYELLNDPARRKNFDDYGYAGPPNQGGGGGAGFPGGFSGGFPGAGGVDPRMAEAAFRSMFSEGGSDFSDLLSGKRTRGRTSRGRPAPEPVESNVTIPFDVAVRGGNVGLEVDGRRIDVKIPAGIDDGKKLRVPAAATGSSDVILKVRVEPHTYYRREGNDLYLDVPITIAEAILGAKVEVPTIDGTRLEVKVPAGTSSGGKLRLRGKGVVGGDQYLVFKLVTPPVPLDDKSKQLIEEFAVLNPQKPRAIMPWA